MKSLSFPKIWITCGTGGVGKTTLSASLATLAAIQGKRALVITIDPAKRLAQSLGLETLGDTPQDLTPRLVRATSRKVEGTLHALMPNTRETLEVFVRSISPRPDIAEQIIKNPIFQIFAKEFSGTNEYMALQKLFYVFNTGEYDCIVLDTPPSRHALHFLDSPALLSRFFDERFIRWLVLPANRVVSVGVKQTLNILEKLTGATFMKDLYDFASSLLETQLQFSANLKAITDLLTSGDVRFVMVAAPSPESQGECLHFIESLHQKKLPFDGLILNRTVGHLQNDIKKESREFELIQSLQQTEGKILKELKSKLMSEKTESPFVRALPELCRDVHSMEDLVYVAGQLEPK